MRRAWPSVWITGASHGIGRALALALLDRGSRVAGSARGATELESIRGDHPGFFPRPLDVTDATATRQAVVDIEHDQGPLDLAIFNAGVYDPLPGGMADPEVFARHMAVNYQGVVNGLMAVLPGMKARGRGQIAVVASVAGYRGLPQAAAYGPTKAALISLSETLRLELRGTGVDLRVVNPGFVSTRLTEKNLFPMPAIISPGEASAYILRGLEGKGFEHAFPFRFAAWMKLIRLLPYRLYFPLMARITRT